LDADNDVTPHWIFFSGFVCACAAVHDMATPMIKETNRAYRGSVVFITSPCPLGPMVFILSKLLLIDYRRLSLSPGLNYRRAISALVKPLSSIFLRTLLS
jgi:hypothetical protein